MATKTWTNTLENNGFILGIDSESVFYLTMKGTTKKAALQKIQAALAEGAAPTDVGASEIITIPFSDLKRVQASEVWSTVDFRYADANNNDKVRNTSFQTEGPYEYCQSIAREIATASKRSPTESSSDAGLVSVLLMPVIFGGIIGAITWVLYMVGADLEAGKEVAATGRKAGFKQLVIWVAGTIGTKLTLAIGGVCLAIVVFWTVRRLVKRPQILTLNFEPDLSNG